MSKQKKKSEIKGGFLSFLAGFILLLVIAVFAADKLGISQMTVSRIERRALSKMNKEYFGD